MYPLYFYRDRHGTCPVEEYLNALFARNDKDSRIKLKKIQDYMNILQQYGMSAGEPYMKHLEGSIWELRPLRDRILFATWYKNSFILLHHVMKKTQKTPRSEIEKAQRELKDLIERSDLS